MNLLVAVSFLLIDWPAVVQNDLLLHLRQMRLEP